MTRDVVAGLRRRSVKVLIANTSAERGRRPSYHLRRVCLHLTATLRVLSTPKGSTVYLAGAGGLGLWYQTMVVLAGRLRRHRIFFHHHSYAYLVKRSFAMTALSECAGPRAEHVVLCSGMGQTLQRRYSAVERMRVCSNAGLVSPWPDVAAVRAPAALVLGHFGNLTLEKGILDVINAFRVVREDLPGTRLMFGGPIIGDEAVALVDRAQVEFGEDLVVLGPVPPDEVNEFYGQLDLFLMPSRYRHEAQPLVLLEAASCGVPSVAYDIGCIASLLPGDHLVAPGGDFTARVRAVCEGLGAPDVRTVIRRATLARSTAMHAAAGKRQMELLDDLAR